RGLRALRGGVAGAGGLARRRPGGRRRAERRGLDRAGGPAAVVRPHLPRFLIDRVAQPGEALPLRSEEAKHARVRRLRVGDAVALFDGAGHSYVGRLESLSRDAAAVRIVEALPERDGESALELTLAVAALKADRLDWVAEKATE